MATITRFEELEIWKLAFGLCEKISEFISRNGLSKDFELRNQFDGSSGSIMDNIAEGFERGSRNEFVNFLGYAKGSSGETRSQLYRVLMRKYISQSEFDETYNLTELIAKKINKLISYLNKSNFKGEKFKDRQTNEPIEFYLTESEREIIEYYDNLEEIEYVNS